MPGRKTRSAAKARKRRRASIGSVGDPDADPEAGVPLAPPDADNTGEGGGKETNEASAAGGAGGGSASAPAAAATAKPAAAPRGRNVSGRPWKKPPAQRTSAMFRPGYHARDKTASLRKFEVRRKQRETLRQLREQEKAMREAKLAELEAAREKRAAKKRRKAELSLKGTAYQVLKDPSKLKKMSKKQLRQIRKTRVNKDGVVEFVGAYEK